ncbi:hypothetical protein LOK49_LG08G01806 [Camellia lanceoleosa]|uniref:Uncharacterized protein n=1 Tax=Camellia lanceoleosa TaxID=1840588 RepID=A0ACC0GTG7_9ERIC|nr:hypothetical protein LOK49_LG08G01806 [Camellia lanceoleosa]
MALNYGLRSCASKLLSSSNSFLPKSANRGFHSTGVKRMGGGHGHDEPYYLHLAHVQLGQDDKSEAEDDPWCLHRLQHWRCSTHLCVIFQQRKTLLDNGPIGSNLSCNNRYCFGMPW